jgi:hypothetical protein
MGIKTLENKIMRKTKDVLDHEISISAKVSKLLKIVVPSAFLYSAYDSFTNITVLEQMAEDGGVGMTPLFMHVSNFILEYPQTGLDSLAFEMAIQWVYRPMISMVLNVLIAGIFIGYFFPFKKYILK